MSKFKFYVLGNFSPNIRTFGKCRCTCYFLKGFSKNIFLDFGAGVFRKFCELLKEEINLPIEFWDERLSTVAAERSLIEGNVRRENRKKVIDMLAAVIILQGYLDSKRIF